MDANSWRAQIATELAASLDSIPHVAAVILGGSVARGWADAYSDLELGVFWSQPPEDDVRQRLLADLQPERIGEFQPFDPTPPTATGTEDSLLLHGFQVDLCHHVVDHVDDCVASVVNDADTSLAKQNLAAVLQHAIPLTNEKWLAARQAKVADYPEELTKKTLQQNYPFFFQQHMSMVVERGEVIFFYNYLSGLQKRIFTTLLALNRRYFCGFKRMAKQLEALELVPPGTIDRLQRCYREPLSEAWATTRALIDEVVELGIRLHPDVDTNEPKTHAYTRKCWSAPPPEFGELGS